MFTLDYKSRKPLYDQLCESGRADGRLRRAVRGEAASFCPEPCRRSWRSTPHGAEGVPVLEHNGIIQTVPGKGSFLAGGGEAKRRQKARGVAALRAALQAALDSGLSAAEIWQECEDYFKEREGKRL